VACTSHGGVATLTDEQILSFPGEDYTMNRAVTPAP
jgi:hypothetical protein